MMDNKDIAIIALGAIVIFFIFSALGNFGYGMMGYRYYGMMPWIGLSGAWMFMAICMAVVVAFIVWIVLHFASQNDKRR